MILKSTLTAWLIVWLSGATLVAQDVPEINYFNLSVNEGKVYLAWQLKAGATCFGIRVDRSTDQINFEDIGGFGGICGDLTKPESYSLIDEDPPQNQRVYYRLELGTGYYTEMRYIDVINLGGKVYQVRPNPVTSESKIWFTNTAKEEHTLTVTNLMGQPVYQQRTREESFTIHSVYFRVGLYPFIIESSGGSRIASGKFVVLR